MESQELHMDPRSQLNPRSKMKFVSTNTQMEHLGAKALEHILQWIDILAPKPKGK